VLGAFFQGLINYEECERQMIASLKGLLFSTNYWNAHSFSAAKEKNASDLMNYIVMPAQMLENNYLLPSYMKNGSIRLEVVLLILDSEQCGESLQPSGEEGSGKADITSIDFEIVHLLQLTDTNYKQCLTEDGKELTFICAIDYKSGKVLLDQLIKPQKLIVNYLMR
jgi:RNA exonuclease 1